MYLFFNRYFIFVLYIFTQQHKYGDMIVIEAFLLNTREKLSHKLIYSQICIPFMTSFPN